MPTSDELIHFLVWPLPEKAMSALYTLRDTIFPFLCGVKVFRPQQMAELGRQPR